MLIKGHYFPGQKRTEKVVLFIRRHWITYLPWISLVILLIFLPWVINGVLSMVGISIIDIYNDLANLAETSEEDIWINYIAIIFLSSYYLFLCAYFLKMWIDYYLDIIIVTPEHLANVQQIGLLNHKVSEQSLLRVQDVTARVDGFWQTFFRFGTVVAETAGDEPNFLMRDVPNPNTVATTILNLHEELIESGGLEEELSEGVGLNRPKPIIEKRKGMINKVVYNLPPNKGVNTKLVDNYKNNKKQKEENKEKTIELEDSRVVVIQEPKPTKQPEKKDKKTAIKKKPVEKIAPQLPKSKSLNIESSWLENTKEKLQKKSLRKKSNKVEEGVLQEGEEIQL